MSTFLFDNIVFGPVKSRRLGNSLGINLLPLDVKFCTFNCVYCECGWNKEAKIVLPHYEDIIPHVEKYFSSTTEKLDSITFGGNGEPTINPDFQKIVEETIRLRDKYLPEVEVSVLTNATSLSKKGVVEALKLVDDAILKIDSVIQEDFELINQPTSKILVSDIIDNIAANFEYPVIQTMFMRGNINGKAFDNTTEESIEKYLATLKRLTPSLVMLYSIDRETPMSGLEKVSADDLNKISDRINKLGFKTLVTP